MTCEGDHGSAPIQNRALSIRRARRSTSSTLAGYARRLDALHAERLGIDREPLVRTRCSPRRAPRRHRRPATGSPGTRGCLASEPPLPIERAQVRSASDIVGARRARRCSGCRHLSVSRVTVGTASTPSRVVAEPTAPRNVPLLVSAQARRARRKTYAETEVTSGDRTIERVRSMDRERVARADPIFPGS